MVVYLSDKRAATGTRAATARSSSKCGFLLWLLLLVLLWLQCAHALPNWRIENLCSPEDNVTENNCTFGGRLVNVDSEKCSKRYVCYVGPGRKCDNVNEERKCEPNLRCTCDGVCQNCIYSQCPICPNYPNYDKRWRKRFFNRNLLSDNLFNRNPFNHNMLNRNLPNDNLLDYAA